MPACQLVSKRELFLLDIYMAMLFAPPKTSCQKGSSSSDTDRRRLLSLTPSYCSLGKLTFDVYKTITCENFRAAVFRQSQGLKAPAWELVEKNKFHFELQVRKERRGKGEGRERRYTTVSINILKSGKQKCLKVTTLKLSQVVPCDSQV